jgi:hypothetical protein
MAKAARDVLVVPGAEVDVERIFCGGRDLLGIRRYALKGETMRILTLLKAYFERKLNKGTSYLPDVSISSITRPITNYNSSLADTNRCVRRSKNRASRRPGILKIHPYIHELHHRSAVQFI